MIFKTPRECALECELSILKTELERLRRLQNPAMVVPYPLDEIELPKSAIGADRVTLHKHAIIQARRNGYGAVQVAVKGVGYSYVYYVAGAGRKDSDDIALLAHAHEDFVLRLAHHLSKGRALPLAEGDEE